MTFVYATGWAGNMNFYLAQDDDTLPEGAVVYAVCDEEECAENLDEFTCRAMTDSEYYEFKGLVRQARELETERTRVRRNSPENPFHRLYAWFKRASRRKLEFEPWSNKPRRVT